MRRRAFYLHAEPDPVFALLHEPTGPRRPVSVLMCPPFGWEDMCSYRSRRQWAEHLAAQGYPVLRIDLPGSGDSGGSAGDPGRLEAWTAAISAASAWLGSEPGCRRAVAIGIGLGGLVAYRAAARGAPIDDLVLWGVAAQGRTVIRELRAFSRLQASAVDPPIGVASAASMDGLAAAGYRLSSETVDALSTVDLAALPLPDPGSRRLLMLGREGTSVDARLQEALESAGVEVTVAPGTGYAGMMEVAPHLARPAVTVFSAVSAWLDAAKPATHASTPDQRVALSGSIDVPTAWGPVREQPLSFDGPDGQLVGVLSEPLEPSGDACLVLLNAGPQRRTGPNRMWVEMGRRWAAHGLPTLRLDLAGIGESDGDGEPFADVGAFYVPEFVGQVRLVLDALEARGLARRFALLGLCSGAYYSFHAALEDPRVASAIMLNPRSVIWEPWVHTRHESREIRGKMRSVAHWRKVLRGQASLRRPLSVALALLRGAVRDPARMLRGVLVRRPGELVGADALDLAFDRLREAGKDVHVVFAGDEPLCADWRREGRLERLDRLPHVALDVISLTADTHTLQPLWLQEQVHGLVDTAVGRGLGLPPAGSASGSPGASVVEGTPFSAAGQ